jgi:hypothetical protein
MQAQTNRRVPWVGWVGWKSGLLSQLQMVRMVRVRKLENQVTQVTQTRIPSGLFGVQFLMMRGLSLTRATGPQVLTLFCVAGILCTSFACTPDLTGDWKIQFKRDSWDHFETATCAISHPHNHLSVNCGDDTQFVSANVDGHRFTWQFKSGLNQSILATFAGKLRNGARAMEGTWQFADSSDNTSGGGTFEATR